MDEVKVEVEVKDVNVERVYIVDEWEGSAFQKWAKNFCNKNQWRVTDILGEYDDCMGHCAYCYAYCKKLYGATVKTPQQFMYLFRKCVIDEFNTFSTRDTNNRSLYLKLSLPKTEASIESDAQLKIKLFDASRELRTVLDIFTDAPAHIMQLLRSEASSCHPKQFWKAVLKYAGVKPSRSVALEKELQKLLS
jgi:hypothetical protein